MKSSRQRCHFGRLWLNYFVCSDDLVVNAPFSTMIRSVSLLASTEKKKNKKKHLNSNEDKLSTPEMSTNYNINYLYWDAKFCVSDYTDQLSKPKNIGGKAGSL